MNIWNCRIRKRKEWEEKIFEERLGKNNIDSKFPILLNTINLQTQESPLTLNKMRTEEYEIKTIQTEKRKAKT